MYAQSSSETRQAERSQREAQKAREKQKMKGTGAIAVQVLERGQVCIGSRPRWCS